jgi:amino acid transporter
VSTAASVEARGIGPFAAALLVFNGIVGAGIFVLPGLVKAEFGAFGPWLFPLFGALMLVVVLPLAAVAARFDVSGGPMAYVDAAFGPVAGFQAGWLFYVAKATAMAANATVFAAYAVGLFPGRVVGWVEPLIVVLLLGSLAVASCLGLSGAVRLLRWASLLKAAPLLLFAVAGLLMFGSGLEQPPALPPLSAVEASALVLLYAFVGFENAMVPAGETADARRSIPRALVRTILATAGFYFIIQLAYTAVAPEASEAAPMIAFGAAIAGPAGALVMTMAALASLLGNLHGNMMTTPRLTQAMGERRLLPGWFAATSERFATPANAIFFYAAVAALLALSGGFVLLAVLGTVARLLLFLMVYASLPRLRARAGEAALPRAPLLAALLGASAICLWALAQNEAKAWGLLAGCLAVGALLYAVARRAAR